MATSDDNIFSLEQRLVLRRLPRHEHRQLQAQTVRVLARIEAAEQLRRVQDEGRRLGGAHQAQPQPRRGLLARLASWIGGQTLIGAATSEHTARWCPDVAQLAAVDQSLLRELREEIAKELEREVLAVLPARLSAARLAVADTTPDIAPTGRRRRRVLPQEEP